MDKLNKVLLGKQGNYILPFLWVHGEPEEKLREYVKVISESNIREFCVESRPHPEFCGQKWWKTMDVLLDEASKNNMRVWVLDDAHYPTGYANGAIEKSADELHRQVICYRTWECDSDYVEIDFLDAIKPLPNKETEIEKIFAQMEKSPYSRVYADDRCLGIYAIRLDTKNSELIHLNPRKEAQTICFRVPEGKWRIYGLYLTRNAGFHRNYINVLSHESCKVLLDAVYEPHYGHYKQYFGNTFAGFFSDEPELGNGHLYEQDTGIGVVENLPWSSELEEILRNEWKGDFEKNLIYLWENEGDDEHKAAARYSYMNLMSKLVAECFSKQLGAWCTQRGVEYIGHLIEDNGLHSRTGTSLGHFFRAQRGQTMAGIDDIGGQVFPQGEDISYKNGVFDSRNGEFYHYTLGKLASSLAAIDKNKKGRSVCEIFGNYGWGEGVQLEKYLADHFMVRGINHFVPHAFSAKDFPDGDCPPHFYAHGHNPQYRHFGALMRYMNRVCEILSDGRSTSKVALIYHGEAEWTGKYLEMDKVGHVLFDWQIDYDIIPQDVFADNDAYGTEIHKDKLIINHNEYGAVIIPYMQYITKEMADVIPKLKNNGILVVFVEGVPEGISNGGDSTNISFEENVVRLEELVEYLDSHNVISLKIIPSYDRIRCLNYKYDNGENVYFLINEGTQKYTGQLFVKTPEQADSEIYEYDAWNNTYKRRTIENHQIMFSLEPRKSVLFIESSKEQFAKLHLLSEKEYAYHCKVEWNKELWERSMCLSVNYPKFEALESKNVPDSVEKEFPEFSGYIAYENSFTGKERMNYILDITDAYEGVEVFVNGKSLGIQIVPTYHYIIPEEMICEGENKVRIEVATTLERQMAKTPNAYGILPEPPACKSGIAGEILLYEAI